MKSIKKPAVPPGANTLHRNPRPLLRAALIVASYLCVFIIFDFFSYQFEVLRGVVAWYPPAGLTYALLLVLGVRFAPAVTIALFISTLFIYRMPQPPYLLFLWAFIISVIYGVAAAFLRRLIRFDWQLGKLRDVTWLVATAVFVSALLAVLSVSSSALSTEMPRSGIINAIFHWWIGETVGVLTVTPFLLVYVMPGLKRFAAGQPVRSAARRSFPRPTLSGIGQAFSIALTLYWVFGARVPDEFRPMYLIVLPLIWIALQRGFKGVSAAILATNSGVLLALWLFQFDLARLGELELLMIVNCIVGLIMGAVIKERRRAEEALSESDDKYRLIVENTGDNITVLDMNFRITYVSPSIRKLRGYSVEEVMAQTLDQILLPESFKKIGEVLAEQMALEAEGTADPQRRAIIELEEYCKDGSRIWVEDVFSFIRDDSGRPMGILSVSRDITDRKRLEEALQKKNEELVLVTDQLEKILGSQDRARLVLLSILEDEKIARQVLRESEEKYRTLIETTPCVICKLKPDGTTIFVNDYLSVVTGYCPDEFIGRNWWDLLYPGELRGQKVQLYEAFKSGDVHGYEMTLRGKEGSSRVILWDSFNTYGTYGELIEINGVGIDITDRKEAEQQARYQLQFLYVVINAIKAPIFFKNTEGRYSGCNAAFEEYVGHPLSELIGKTVFDLWPRDLAEVYHQKDLELLETGGEQTYEAQARSADGSYRDMLYRKSLYHGKDGSIGGIVGVMVDVTDRKRAEEAVRESERFALSTVNALPSSIAIIDERGEILSVNSAWRTFAFENMQNPIDVFEGINYLTVCDMAQGEHADGAAEFAAGIRAVIKKELESYLLEYPCHSPSVKRWFTGRVNRFPGDGPTRIVVSHTDITELKLAEEKISTSLHEKEVLLREIHHRVKNNMQVISSLIGLQNSYITNGADVSVALGEMQNRIKSMAIVHEKLYRSENLARIDFSEYLASLSASVFQSLNIDADRVELRLNVGLVTLGIDEAVPCGLLVNELVTNALNHGFPGGRKGVITVSMEDVGEGGCRISIKDDGVGLPDGFDVEASNSLGIRLVGILTKQIGGTLEVRTEKGMGSEFVVSFPVVKEGLSHEGK